MLYLTSRFCRFSAAILVLAFAVIFVLVSAVPAQANPTASDDSGRGGLASTSLGNFSPTFVGPAALGCKSPGCSLLSGPFFSPSTESFSMDHEGVAGALVQSLLSTSAQPVARPKSMPVHQRPRPPAVDPPPPTVSCQPLGP